MTDILSFMTKRKIGGDKVPILDFKEIPQANLANGEQDTFELFARDFLEMIGLKTISGLDRGQDGGRDIIVIEQRKGVVGISEIRWLVSCKHKAHSGTSVRDNDETDISDRIRAHKANGFIGFYSTIISSPLGRKLESLKQNFEVMIFDRERIEQILLESENGNRIAKRYFLKSFLQWENHNFAPSNFLTEYNPLKCKNCGRDLLDREIIEHTKGIIAFVEDIEYGEENGYKQNKYIDIYWSCKGECDRKLRKSYEQKGFSTSWEDISDIVIPVKYIMWNIAILNRIRNGDDIFEDSAYESLKEFIIKVSQLVLRNQTEQQSKRVLNLSSIPSYL